MSTNPGAQSSLPLLCVDDASVGGSDSRVCARLRCCLLPSSLAEGWGCHLGCDPQEPHSSIWAPIRTRINLVPWVSIPGSVTH